MNRYSCNWIDKGLFVSHNGVAMCCEHKNKEKLLPSKFWSGQQRKVAIDHVGNGSPVSGCDTCYEKEAKQVSSTRHFSKKYSDIPQKKNPVIMDLDLSNFCNLKCLMCGPDRSSTWAGKINKVNQEILEDLITISGDVKHLIIQGGEPTIMPEYQYYFELLTEKKYIGNINLQIITNATNINKKFYKSLELFKSVRLSVSIDAYGKANDYIRWPSKFQQIEKNLEQMCNLKNIVRIEILNTLNILSMFDYGEFLNWCKKMQDYFDANQRYFGVVPMKVVDPLKFSPFIAPLHLKNKFINDIKTFFQHSNLTHNVNFKSELSLLAKRIEKSDTNPDSINDLKDSVQCIDTQRNVKIVDYIPNFYTYI